MKPVATESDTERVKRALDSTSPRAMTTGQVVQMMMRNGGDRWTWHWFLRSLAVREALADYVVAVDSSGRPTIWWTAPDILDVAGHVDKTALAVELKGVGKGARNKPS